MTKKLPEEYLARMKALLGEEEYAAYLASLSEESCHGIRLNNLKGSTQVLSGLLDQAHLTQACALEKIPWISNGYYTADTAPLSAHPYYHAGLYYIQEPSAMTPAENLRVDPADAVLDLCAAPGGKATQLAASLHGSGFLLANDISASRGKALVKNLEQAGCGNCCVTAEDPKKLAERCPETFDKILLDAPCSGEGMFRRDPKSTGAWLEKGPSYYAPVQASLLDSAAALLKEGGMLLYSTCTFSTEENEAQIEAFLKRHPSFEPRQLRRFDGFASGYGSLTGAVRIFPHRLRGEGHFLCLLQKTGPEAHRQKEVQTDDGKTVPFRKLPAPARAFLQTLRFDFESGRFLQEKERIYYLKEDVRYLPALRYLRTGLLIGRCVRDRFEPSRALALALSPERTARRISVPAADPMVQKYLRGESFPAEEPDRLENGWILFCTDGYPLGWLKASGTMLKNSRF